MFTRTRTVVSAFALSLAVAGPLTAQEGKPVAANNAPALTAPAPAAKGVVIKHEQLQSVLENLGYDVKTPEGDRWFRFPLERDGWTIQMQAAVTDECVYVMAFLNARERMKDMPIEYYQRLLARNAAVYPYSFLMTGGDLYVAHSIPNHGVNPAALRRLVDGMAAKCIESGDDWVPSRAMKQIEEARASAVPGPSAAAKTAQVAEAARATK